MWLYGYMIISYNANIVIELFPMPLENHYQKIFRKFWTGLF
jgi:hypothetical protein